MNKLLTIAILALGSLGMTGCQFNNSESFHDISAALKKKEVSLADYKYATIYESTGPGFVEIQMQRLMEDHGLTTIGENETGAHQKVLGVRYSLVRSAAVTPGITVSGPRWTLTVTLEDVSTDKTLVSVFSESQSEGMAAKSSQKVKKQCWDQASSELEEIFEQY